MRVGGAILPKKEIKIIRTGVFGVNSYIVPLNENKVFVVDPADHFISRDEGKIAEYLKAEKLDCVMAVLTHSHFDHILGLAQLKTAFPDMSIAIHENESMELSGTGNAGPMNQSLLGFFGMTEIMQAVCMQPGADVLLKDGDFIRDSQWKVIHTPGHSPGSICLYNKEDGLLISGDTFFDYGGYGRTDMYGGDEAVIRHSLQLLREKIPAGTKVYPGHDSFGFSW